jgi:hypothetical protein
MQLLAISPISNTYLRTMKTSHLLIRVYIFSHFIFHIRLSFLQIISSETFLHLINRKHLVFFQSQCALNTVQICIYLPLLYNNPWLIFKGTDIAVLKVLQIG